MADIKTKKSQKDTIKTLDKFSVMSEKMKASYAKTKERTENSYQAEETSPSEYAIGKVNNVEKIMSQKGRAKLNNTGRRSVTETKENFKKAKDVIKEKRISQETRGKAITKERVLAGAEKRDTRDINVKSIKGAKIKNNRASLEHFRHKSIYQIQQQKQAKKLAQNRLQKTQKTVARVKQTASKVTSAVRRALLGLRALFMAIFAGGWIAVIVVIICCLFGAAFYFFGDEGSGNYTPVSEEVEAYTPIIKEYAKEYSMEEYVELIKAVMMQESGGKGNDPMQSSECGFNTKYPKKPNGITDPNYSIKCGIQNLKSVLNAAKVQNPVDMDRIKLALQGYNFGNGYIPWVVEKYGGYSKASAIEFSNEQAKKLGWDSYGDAEYVEHVLRYYPYGDYSYNVEFNGKGKLGLPIKNMTKDNISSHFGPRPSPGGIGSKYHEGLDIAFPTGTKVLACESGTVTTAGWNGGLGKCIIIRHGGSIETIYGHLSSINVKEGQKVVRGQVIGEVGNTGNSTGPHLHLGVRLNGKLVNPEKGWLTIP